MVPAGEHTIEMSFEPASYRTGNTVNWIGSVLLLILIVGVFGLNLRREFTPTESAVV
jgi:hypothetical protein